LFTDATAGEVAVVVGAVVGGTTVVVVAAAAIVVVVAAAAIVVVVGAATVVLVELEVDVEDGDVAVASYRITTKSQLPLNLAPATMIFPPL
jgi:hypothetical protein